MKYDKTKYIIDDDGNKVAVIMPVEEYNEIRERLEEYENLIKTHQQDDIPKAHQDLVLQRLKKVREHPEDLLDWDDVKKQLQPDEEK